MENVSVDLDEESPRNSINNSRNGQNIEDGKQESDMMHGMSKGIKNTTVNTNGSPQQTISQVKNKVFPKRN